MALYLKMKLPRGGILARLCCVQVAFILPVAAQFIERNSPASDEIRLKPDGLNLSPGWALGSVGKRFSQPGTYSYPDTTTPVRLYLIDTAVRDSNGFHNANPNLIFEATIAVGGGIGVSPTPRDHGTQMLSLIAGIGTGVATGTPIHVVNYDIYANNNTTDPTTSVTNLATAISKAVTHSRNPNTVPMRSVICIATSSIEPGPSRDAIDSSIDAALAAGIPVIISAGNLGADAANFTPPSNGTKAGVICVGASDENNFALSSSNYGAPVDILAPGDNVPSRSASATSDIVLMSGTSPATALVAGAVLAKLSASPTHTPAGIESALKTAAEVAASGCLLRTFVPPVSGMPSPDVTPDGPITSPTTSVSLTWDTGGAGQAAPPPPEGNIAPTAVDADSDGVPDVIEVFNGTPGGASPSPVMSPAANQQVQFKFPISSDLFDGSANPFILRNGYTWRIRCSSGLSSWTVPAGQLSKTTDAQGRAWLTATFPATQPSCFARIEVVAP